MSRWIMFVVLLIVSCGSVDISRSCALDGEACPDRTTRTVPKDGSSCSVFETADAVTISCTNGTRSVFDKPKSGTDGKDGDSITGPKGDSGVDGYSSVFMISESLTCPSGGKLFLVATDTNRSGQLEVGVDSGLQSADICNGVTGADGQDGVDGADGTDGMDAPATPFTTVQVIDPCGKQSSFDEVLLKLADGSILASFSENSNGKNTRFSLLVPGSYKTTDGTNCYFTVNSNMAVVNEHN